MQIIQKYKFFRVVPALLLTTGMSSCLKEAATPNLSGSGVTNNVVEFQNTSVPESYTSIYPVYDNNDLTITNDTAGFNMIVDYAGAEEYAPKDITVTIAVDTAALAAYNNAESASYEAPDSSLYGFSKTVTIAKGTHQTITRVTINANANFSFSASYALPLTIKSASFGILSTNYATALFEFTVSNAYAGSYTSTGYLFHPSSPRAINATYTISTAGQNSCTFPVGDLGGNGYTYKADIPAGGGALTNYVATGSTPTGTNSGFMTLDNPGGTSYASASPNVPGTSPWLSSTYNNTYDASAKTFWVHVGYISSGGTSQSSYTRQIYQKFVKK